MLGIQLIVLAALFVSASNFFMRKSIDAGGSSKAFLVVQLFLVFLVAILLNPVRSGNYTFEPCMAAFGLAGGVILAFMMAALGRSLETGPAGLTFATLNASTVMPSIFMALLFGRSFGYLYTVWNGIGAILVVLGLFWAGWNSTRIERKKGWVSFVTAVFFLHVLFLIFLSWRALFINFPDAPGLFLSFDLETAKNEWFMPMIFLSASLIQAVLYLLTERRAPYKKEIFYGVLGGVTNGVGTFFMIWATEVSTSLEHALIYPLFAITILLVCNGWGQWLYKEKVNWKANGLCVLGLLIGTLDWKVIFSG